jgi:hypothetical protein
MLNDVMGCSTPRSRFTLSAIPFSTHPSGRAVGDFIETRLLALSENEENRAG